MARAPDVASLAEPLSGSPMETRIRLSADDGLVREQPAGWRIIGFRAGRAIRSPATVAAMVAAERRARGAGRRAP